MDVTSYRDGIRRTHNSNRDGSAGRANADEVRTLAVNWLWAAFGMGSRRVIVSGHAFALSIAVLLLDVYRMSLTSSADSGRCGSDLKRAARSVCSIRSDGANHYGRCATIQRGRWQSARQSVFLSEVSALQARLHLRTQHRCLASTRLMHQWRALMRNCLAPVSRCTVTVATLVAADRPLSIATSAVRRCLPAWRLSSVARLGAMRT